MKIFNLFLLFLILISSSFTNANTCGTWLTDGLEDFAVEEYFRNVDVRPGVVNRASKAFILWRQKTPPHIPDSAFNYHYYSKKQRAAAAGFGKIEEGAPEQSRLENLSERGWQTIQNILLGRNGSALNYIYETEKDPTYHKEPAVSVAKRLFSSPEKLLQKLGINFEYKKEKFYGFVDRQSKHPNNKDKVVSIGRFFIDSEGRLFIATEEDNLLLQKELNLNFGLTHVELAPFIFGTQTNHRDLITYGYINLLPNGKFYASSSTHVFESVRLTELIDELLLP